MSETVSAIIASFDENVKAVQSLVDFDHAVLDFTLENLSALQRDVDAKYPVLADRVGNTVGAIRTVRSTDSMRKHYTTIYNQCVVLLVSHFGTALRSLFVAAAPNRVGTLTTDTEALKEELKFSLKELGDLNFELRDTIGEMLIAKRDISFQDMQSTTRAFRAYLGVAIAEGADRDDITFAQAARHAIVHHSANVDARFLRQVAGLRHRTIKPQFNDALRLSFTPDELQHIATTMRHFVYSIAAQLRSVSEA